MDIIVKNLISVVEQLLYENDFFNVYSVHNMMPVVVNNDM